MTTVTRRKLLTLGAGAIAAASSPHSVQSQTTGEAGQHGLSVFGDLGYPANFAKLNYVNSAAPKGGTFSQLAGAGTTTFNSLNGFILKGDAALDMELVFASLMARAYNEPDSVYGLAADQVTVSPDGLIYRFRLREGISFHDGSPLTPIDVVFSLSTLKEKGHPNISILLRDMEAVEAEGSRVVLVRFKAGRSPDAPLIASRLPIFSQAYYSTHRFEETTLEPPLGSGPYRVGKFEQGRFLEFERVRGWWGADLPIMRGLHNFDILRYEYYRDRDVAFDGFSARNYAFREEYTARVWSTRYVFPAVLDGRVKRETLPDERPAGAQGWMMNTRRAKFANRKVREALALAFDFEWANQNLMFGYYKRTHSYFQNSEMMAQGKPSAAELVLLEPFRDKLPNDVFGEPWIPPTSTGSGQDRRQLLRSGELLAEAGWTINDGKRVNAAGERLAVELLFFERASEPHHAVYMKSLTTLGIDCSMRMVDPAQFRSRVHEFDFDIAVNRVALPSTPGDALRAYFSSQAAKTKGSVNFSGIADPIVDALIERAAAATDRATLNTSCRALDRVLRAGVYWIPHWYKPAHWIAYWDMFDRPPNKPRYARGAPETWWYDAGKAARITGPG